MSKKSVCDTKPLREYNWEKYVQVDWREHMVSLDTGINMAYWDMGPEDGEAVMLIHGVTDGHISWMHIVPRLAAEGFHCYVVDCRGNGKTDSPHVEGGYTAQLTAKDILNLMAKESIGKVHLVGHSYGSFVAQILSAEAPHKFGRVILMDTAVSCAGNKILEDSLKDVMNIENMPYEFYTEWATMSNEDLNFQKAALEHLLEMSPIAWKNLMTGAMAFDNEDGICHMGNPITVIWGTEDAIFTYEDQAKLLKALHGHPVKFVPVEGASHSGFWDSMETSKKYAELIAANCRL